MRLFPIALAGVTIALVGCTRYELTTGDPEIELSDTAIDFGEVERGYWRERSIAVYNQGTATLTVTDYAFQTGSSDAFYFEDPDKEISPNTFAELIVRYTPTHEGSDAGAIVINSDDADEPELLIFLQGGGFVPHCEVEPTLLYFPIDEGPQSQCFFVHSTGSGPLTIEDATLEDSTAEFSLTFPAGYEPPVQIDPGLTVEITATFTPSDLEGRLDRVVLTTSDPDLEDGLAYVELMAAGEPPDGENQPPLVEITYPPNGSVVIEGTSVTFEGQVADMEEPAEQLGILWHSSLDGYASGDAPSAAGEVAYEFGALSVGEHLITLSAYDSEGAQGSDSITMTVYEDDEELEYVVSGGPTPYHYFHVDDDVTISINGVPVFVDTDGSQDHHAPAPFFAAPGDELRVTATDAQWCTKAIVALHLHLGGIYTQELSGEVSASACDEHDDYDPSYEGPWPNIFLDETFTISIP